MSYREWGYTGYGIDTYKLDEKHIDERKLKKLFLENKYNINEVFKLKENDIQNIQKAKTTNEILELEPLREYEDDDMGYYSNRPLEQITELILNKKDYGFEIAEENQDPRYIYLPNCMPWQMGNIKDLTKEELDNFVNEALKEIYKEEYYDKIPRMDYINCVTGGL